MSTIIEWGLVQMGTLSGWTSKIGFLLGFDFPNAKLTSITRSRFMDIWVVLEMSIGPKSILNRSQTILKVIRDSAPLKAFKMKNQGINVEKVYFALQSYKPIIISFLPAQTYFQQARFFELFEILAFLMFIQCIWRRQNRQFYNFIKLQQLHLFLANIYHFIYDQNQLIYQNLWEMAKDKKKNRKQQKVEHKTLQNPNVQTQAPIASEVEGKPDLQTTQSLSNHAKVEIAASQISVQTHEVPNEVKLEPIKNDQLPIQSKIESTLHQEAHQKQQDQQKQRQIEKTEANVQPAVNQELPVQNLSREVFIQNQLPHQHLAQPLQVIQERSGQQLPSNVGSSQVGNQAAGSPIQVAVQNKVQPQVSEQLNFIDPQVIQRQVVDQLPVESQHAEKTQTKNQVAENTSNDVQERETENRNDAEVVAEKKEVQYVVVREAVVHSQTFVSIEGQEERRQREQALKNSPSLIIVQRAFQQNTAVNEIVEKVQISANIDLSHLENPVSKQVYAQVQPQPQPQPQAQTQPKAQTQHKAQTQPQPQHQAQTQPQPYPQAQVQRAIEPQNLNIQPVTEQANQTNNNSEKVTEKTEERVQASTLTLNETEKNENIPQLPANEVEKLPTDVEEKPEEISVQPNSAETIQILQQSIQYETQVVRERAESQPVTASVCITEQIEISKVLQHQQRRTQRPIQDYKLEVKPQVVEVRQGSDTLLDINQAIQIVASVQEDHLLQQNQALQPVQEKKETENRIFILVQSEEIPAEEPEKEIKVEYSVEVPQPLINVKDSLSFSDLNYSVEKSVGKDHQIYLAQQNIENRLPYPQTHQRPVQAHISQPQAQTVVEVIQAQTVAEVIQAQTVVEVIQAETVVQTEAKQVEQAQQQVKQPVSLPIEILVEQKVEIAQPQSIEVRAASPSEVVSILIQNPSDIPIRIENSVEVIRQNDSNLSQGEQLSTSNKEAIVEQARQKQQMKVHDPKEVEVSLGSAAINQPEKQKKKENGSSFASKLAISSVSFILAGGINWALTKSMQKSLAVGAVGAVVAGAFAFTNILKH